MGEGRPTGWLGLMRLVVITTPAGDEARTHDDVARAAITAGCRAIQLRDKEMCDREFAATARTLKETCDGAGALLFVNDRVDVAAAVGAAGVHLGDKDLAVADARRLLPEGVIVGYSPDGALDARAAVALGADYLGVGPVFATGTKSDAGSPIGPEGLAPYEELAPVIAIGGINDQNAALAVEAGARGVAVASAISAAPDMERAARAILEVVSSPLTRED